MSPKGDQTNLMTINTEQANIDMEIAIYRMNKNSNA